MVGLMFDPSFKRVPTTRARDERRRSPIPIIERSPARFKRAG